MTSRGAATAAPEKPEWMTPADLVEWLQLPSIHTLHQWRYQGIGPRAHKIGRHLRYRLSDVEEWLTEQTEPTRPAGPLVASGPTKAAMPIRRESRGRDGRR